jgi:phosphate transport system substrate-binding protein
MMLRARHLAAVALLAALPGCSSRKNIRTTLQNKGSDTLVNLAQAWAEEYRKVRPDVAVAVSGGGSGTGIASLMNGTVDIANASREIKPDEAAKARENTGKDPVQHLVAYDALAIYVHADNPIAGVDKKQLACIYGETGTCGHWTDLGIEVPGCADQIIVRVSRQNNSGTYQYFRDWVVGPKGDFKLGSNDMSGSKDVVDLVEHTPCSIAFSGIGYKSEHVRVICVAETEGGECVLPTPENTLSHKYPISRGLYMYTLGEPTGELGDFIGWVLSDAGQAFVEGAGEVPLPPAMRRQPGAPAPAPSTGAKP